MTLQDYRCMIKTSLSAREALAKINNVSGWWAHDTSGCAQDIGDRFTVRFGDTSVEFAIMALEPEARTVWSVLDCHLPWLVNKTEWNGTSILWEVPPDDDATTVAMTHQGLNSDRECFDTCRRGWDFYVTESLQQYLSTGTGFPERDNSAAGSH